MKEELSDYLEGRSEAVSGIETEAAVVEEMIGIF